jgi:anti-anti-sigma regulatory factor
MPNADVISIDLCGVLHTQVSRGYGDLVTRPTGQAVRSGVEEHLASNEADVAVIDFSGVRCMDYSCADEIVGKLLLAHGRARYFMLRGVSDGQCEAIETVLERYGLAVVIEDRTGRLRVLGAVADAVRKAFEHLVEYGPQSMSEGAGPLDLPPDTARAAFDELRDRRLALARTPDREVVPLA